MRNRKTVPVRDRLLRFSLLAVLMLVLAACGGDEAAPEEVAEEEPIAETTEEAPAEETADAAATEAPEDAGTAADGAGDEPTVDLSGVSITASSSLPGSLSIPQFYAFDLLREWGAELEVVTLTTTTGISALIAGQTDVAPHGADELLLGAAEGADPVAVGSTEAAIGYVLVGTQDIESPEDLAGATIGISGPAGFDAILSRLALEDAGLDPATDASFVQVGGSPDRAAALLAGNIDAATIFIDDWFELVEQTDELQIVVRLAELVADIPGSVYFSLAPYWEENPDVALAVACANLEANQWAQENPEEFVEFGTELLEGSPEAIEALYDFAMDVEMYPTDPEAVLSVSGMEDLMDALVEAGDIAEPIEDIGTVIDTAYLEQAAQMGCGQ